MSAVCEQSVIDIGHCPVVWSTVCSNQSRPHLALTESSWGKCCASCQRHLLVCWRLLVVPRCWLSTLGPRAYSVAGPSLSNSTKQFERYESWQEQLQASSEDAFIYTALKHVAYWKCFGTNTLYKSIYLLCYLLCRCVRHEAEWSVTWRCGDASVGKGRCSRVHSSSSWSMSVSH